MTDFNEEDYIKIPITKIPPRPTNCAKCGRDLYDFTEKEHKIVYVQGLAYHEECTCLNP